MLSLFEPSVKSATTSEFPHLLTALSIPTRAFNISNASKIVGSSPPSIRPGRGGLSDLHMSHSLQAGIGSVTGLQAAQVPHLGDFTLQPLRLQFVSQPEGKS